VALIALATVALAGRVGGEPNRPEWRWETLETTHFAIHYPEARDPEHPVAAAETALSVARIAERAWLDLAVASSWWPRTRIHIVLRDDGDALVGRAVPAWNLVTISVHPGDDLARARGTTDLLALVVVHELAHVFSHARASAIGRAATVGPEIGGVGWAGAVGIGGAVRFAGGPPSGWSEGEAEWLAEQAGVAWPSAERSATLRVSALADDLPTWAEWTLPPEADLWGIGEQRYQAGYAFARERPEAFALAAEFAHRRWTPAFERPWRRGLGERGADAWEAFGGRLALRARAWEEARAPVEGAVLTAEPKPRADALVVWYPTTSPDGAWLGEQRGTWTGAFPAAGGDGVWVPGGGGYAFVPGASALIASTTRRPHRPAREDGFRRLVRVDLTCGSHARCAAFLPGTERASDPAVSPDGTRLAWLRFHDGRNDVVLAGIDGSDPTVLAAPRAPLSGLSFSPAGDHLVTAAWVDGQQDLWEIAADGGPPRRLTDDGPNEVDPRWAPDGSIVFVAEVDGVTDVFRWRDGEVRRLTRVTGAAATPSIDPTGALRYAAFDAFGWRARLLPAGDFLDTPEPAFAPTWALTAPAAPPPTVPAAPYRAVRALRPASLIPVLRIEPPAAPAPGTVAPRGGAWLQVVDAVENVSVDGLFLLGADLLAAGSITWRGWRPDLTLDLSHAGRLPGRTPRALDRAAVSMDLPLYAGLSATLSGLGYRLDDTGGAWATAGLALDDRRFAGGAWVTGARTEQPWLRVDGRATAIGRLGHDDHRLTLGVEGAWTDRTVEAENRLFLGGDHPAAWLTAQLQGSSPFPALAAYEDTGDVLAVARAGWQVPLLADRAARLGPITGTDLFLFAGGDVGDTWAEGETPTPRAEAVGDLRWRSELAGAAWDGCARAAWSPGLEPRFYLSLGAGW
jgi:hypothetical protein